MYTFLLYCQKKINSFLELDIEPLFFFEKQAEINQAYDVTVIRKARKRPAKVICYNVKLTRKRLRDAKLTSRLIIPLFIHHRS